MDTCTCTVTVEHIGRLEINVLVPCPAHAARYAQEAVEAKEQLIEMMMSMRLTREIRESTEALDTWYNEGGH